MHIECVYCKLCSYQMRDTECEWERERKLEVSNKMDRIDGVDFFELNRYV